MNLKPGDAVRILAPGNARLDGTAAVVESVAEWGYHLAAPAAATGHYRALPDEVEPLQRPHAQPGMRPLRRAVLDAREQGFTGETCGHCQGLRVVRNGNCTVCRDCGQTSGCS